MPPAPLLPGLPSDLAARLLQLDASPLAGLQLGVACSSFQTEGGLDGPGEPATHWRRWQREGRLEGIGRGADLWGRYPELARRARSLGLDVLRVSVEWARLAPATEELDPHAARAYAQRFTLLREAGVEPVVTLSHFTHPAWLGEDFWLDERSPELFARYAARAAVALGRALGRLGQRPLTRLVTLNEPNMLALATYGAGVFPHREASSAEGSPLGPSRVLRCYDHLLAAHALAARNLRDAYARLGWPRPELTTNLNLLDVYLFSGFAVDLLRAPGRGVARRDLAAHLERRRAWYDDALAGHPTERRHMPKGALRAEVSRVLGNLLARAIPVDFFERTVRALYEGGREPLLDVVSLDVYDPWLTQAIRGADALFAALAGRGAPAEELAAEVAPAWEWTHEPAMLARGLEALHDPEDPRPLDVLENGMALRRLPGSPAEPRADGLRRPRFLAEQAVALAWARLGRGLPVRAWCYWTVVDNYELGSWTPRFGLYGLPDAAPDGAPAPWSELDAAGDDAAGTLRALTSPLRAARANPAQARECLLAWLSLCERGGAPE